MRSWTLPCASSLVPSVLHLSHGFQCSPTLNRQPYDGRLPLTSWWRKSLNITVGQSSPIFLTHQMTNDIQEAAVAGLTTSWRQSRWRHNWKSAQVVNSHLVCDPTIRQPASATVVSTEPFLHRTGTLSAEENGDLQTLICVLVATPRRYPTLSNTVSWQNWMVAYLGYTLWMKTLFHCWPIMVHDTHTRRRRLAQQCSNNSWLVWLLALLGQSASSRQVHIWDDRRTNRWTVTLHKAPTSDGSLRTAIKCASGRVPFRMEWIPWNHGIINGIMKVTINGRQWTATDHKRLRFTETDNTLEKEAKPDVHDRS